eukprot:11597758-Alexandrium_andersonii.AAC.1
MLFCPPGIALGARVGPRLPCAAKGRPTSTPRSQSTRRRRDLLSAPPRRRRQRARESGAPSGPPRSSCCSGPHGLAL